MSEREVKITYRKSRNPRAVKVWETGEFYSVLVEALEIQKQLEDLAVRENTTLDNCKPTVLPTEMLYSLVSAYSEAYNLLMKEGLIKSGNISKVSPTIH